MNTRQGHNLPLDFKSRIFLYFIFQSTDKCEVLLKLSFKSAVYCVPYVKLYCQC